MSVPVKQCTFAGGEIAPSAYARSDLALYEKSARTLRNMVCMKHGGVTGRPATMYVGTTLNGGNAVRLIPFIFNETGLGQSYVLEFGNKYIAFYQNGAVVVSGGSAYTIASPYLQADLALLNFKENADVITIVHQNYAPMQLVRNAATNWVLSTIVFGPSLAGPAVVSVTGKVGTSTLTYRVTAIAASGEESLFTQGGAGNQTIPTTSDLTTAVTITWTAVPGAVSYVVYSILNGVPGRIGAAVATSFLDYGYTPDFTNQPPIVNQPFSGAGNFPATVGFVQQRRAFANTLNNPIGFWLSQPGLYSNFDVHVIPQASDAVIGSVAGEEVNAIEHLTELKFMLMLTAGAEIYVQGNGTGVVTPSAINASVQSQYGCAPLRPLKTGDVLIFLQALGSKIRDFAFDFAIDGYRGNDISIFATHLFEGYQIVDWCYQKEPDSIIWAVRSDGQLLSCTYIREQQVLAWTHHDFINGFVENIAAIPENGTYAVYASIRRTINGSIVRYIERLSQRLWQGPALAVAAGTANAVGDLIDAPFCDCSAQYDGRNTGPITMTLTAAGGFQQATGTEYQQKLTLTSSAAYFGIGQTAQVGDQIFLQDAAWIASKLQLYVGPSGNQVKLTIQSVTSNTIAVVTPDGAVPLEFQNQTISIWARAVQAVTGLGYLAGQKVSVWADRFLVGSPLNSKISSVYTVSQAGSLTLDKPYSVIWVGLPMIQDVETLDLETYFGETILARRKRVAGLNGYLYNTRSFYSGSENPDFNLNNANQDPLYQLFPLKAGVTQVTHDEPPPLLTAQEYIITMARWNKRGGIFMRNVDPVPWTLLAVGPREEDAVTTPYKRV